MPEDARTTAEDHFPPLGEHMPNYPDTPRRSPPGLLKSAALNFRDIAEKRHGCNIGMGAVGDSLREPCDCHYGRLADECWLAYLDSEAALQEAIGDKQ